MTFECNYIHFECNRSMVLCISDTSKFHRPREFWWPNTIKWMERGGEGGGGVWAGDLNRRQPNNFPIFAFNPSVQLETKPPLTNAIVTPYLYLLDVFSISFTCTLILYHNSCLLNEKKPWEWIQWTAMRIWLLCTDIFFAKMNQKSAQKQKYIKWKKKQFQSC